MGAALWCCACVPAHALDTASLIRQGRTHYEKGRIGEALRVFELVGSEPEALYYRFRIHMEDLRDTETARRMGERLVKEFPASMQAQRAHAVLETLVAATGQRTGDRRQETGEKSQKAEAVKARPVDKSRPAEPPKAAEKPKEKPVEKPKTEERAKVEPKPAVADTKPAPLATPVVSAPPDVKPAEPKPTPPPAPVVPAKPSPSPREAEPVVQVNLTADLKDFLKGVSELTGQNILYDQSVGGQVVMSGPADLPMSEVMDLAQHVLAMRGFTLVKMDEGWKVMPTSVALRANIPVLDTPAAGMSQEYITQIIRVDPRLSLNEIRNLLASYLGPNNNFQVLPKLNLLLLTDTRENVEKILDLIRRLEGLQGRVVFKMYALKFTKVQDLKSRLDAMLASYLGKTDFFTMPIVEMNSLWVAALPEDVRRIEVLIQELDTDFAYDVQMTVIPLQYASEEGVAKLVGELMQVGTARYATENFKIIPDPRRRSVILSTVSPKILALVTKLIKEIDQPDVRRAENIHIYKIGNADALKIADKLTTLYKDQAAADRIGIVADEQSNSLIITANAQRYAELEQIIKQLDLSRAQVWLEVYVVEASADLTKKIGIQWFGETTRGVSGSNYTGGVGVVTGTTPGQEGLTIGITKAGTTLPSAFNAFLDNKDFDVLSTPHILVKDNEQAKISVGDVIPILQNSQVTPTGSITRSFNFENVGTNLSITPHVNEPKVTLEFTMAIQEVKSVAEIGAPTRTNRDLTTTITIESGQTAVLGGILGKRRTQGRSGVPIISKLPYVGALFRKDVYENSKTNLLVFITPRIVETAEQLEALSKQKKIESARDEAMKLGEGEAAKVR